MSSQNKNIVSSLAQETPVWDFLDKWCIPFRATMQDLIAKFGRLNSPLFLGEENCALPWNNSALDKNEGSLSFRMDKASDLFAPPASLTMYVNKNGSARSAFNYIGKYFEAIFGSGIVTNTSNTEVLNWKFGNAEVKVTCFDLSGSTSDFGLSSDQKKMYAENAIVEITPFWTSPLSKAEADLFSHSELLFSTDDFNLVASYGRFVRTFSSKTNAVKEAFLVKLKLDKGLLFIAGNRDICQVLTISDIQSIELVKLLAAKGPGYGELKIKFLFAGVKQSVILTIASCPAEKISQLEKLAKVLSGKTGKPLSICESQDY